MSFDAKQFVQRHQKNINLIIKSARLLAVDFLSSRASLLAIRTQDLIDPNSDDASLALFLTFKASLFCKGHITLYQELDASSEESDIQLMAFQAFVKHAFREHDLILSYDESGILEWLSTTYAQLVKKHHPKQEAIFHFVYQPDFEVNSPHRLPLTPPSFPSGVRGFDSPTK